MDGPYKVDRTYDPAIYCKRSSVTGPGVSIAFTSDPFEMQKHLNAAYAAGRASLMPLVDALYDELGSCPMFDYKSGTGCGKCDHCKAVTMYLELGKESK